VITKSIALSDIRIDGGTQVRAAIDQQVVADYAEAMTSGAQFPPIVVFHDGSHHHLADGFHRFLAAQRLQFREFVADVRPGTKEDALWFALGANRINGHRLSGADKKHAILLALAAWPERSSNQIAEQIGVNAGYLSRVKAEHNVQATPDARVVGRDGKSYPATSPKPMRQESAQFVAVKQLVQEGKSSKDIKSATGAADGTIAKVRKSLGLTVLDKTRNGIAQRRERIGSMAAEGYSSRQIAAAIGITGDRVRELARRIGVDVHADKDVGKSPRHNSNRIIERIVMDAENLTEGVDLIKFAELDREQLTDWLRSLTQSRDKLGSFIRRLMKEQQRNGEAA
jgi:ParB-like chromosome segregation protein Spo0J